MKWQEHNMNSHLSSPRSNRSTASNSTPAASIADQKRASSPPTSPTRSNATMLRPAMRTGTLGRGSWWRVLRAERR